MAYAVLSMAAGLLLVSCPPPAAGREIVSRYATLYGPSPGLLGHRTCVSSFSIAVITRWVVAHAPEQGLLGFAHPAFNPEGRVLVQDPVERGSDSLSSSDCVRATRAVARTGEGLSIGCSCHRFVLWGKGVACLRCRSSFRGGHDVSRFCTLDQCRFGCQTSSRSLRDVHPDLTVRLTRCVSGLIVPDMTFISAYLSDVWVGNCLEDERQRFGRWGPWLSQRFPHRLPLRLPVACRLCAGWSELHDESQQAGRPQSGPVAEPQTTGNTFACSDTDQPSTCSSSSTVGISPSRYRSSWASSADNDPLDEVVVNLVLTIDECPLACRLRLATSGIVEDTPCP